MGKDTMIKRWDKKCDDESKANVDIKNKWKEIHI